MNNKTNSELPYVIMSFVGVIFLISVIITFFFVAGRDTRDSEIGESNGITTKADIQVDVTPKSYIPITYNDVIVIPDYEMNAKNAILVDLNTNTAIAQRYADEQIYPASLTKIMTLLVAVEAIENDESKSINDTFLMSSDIIDTLIKQNASRAGFIANENVPIIDLLYGAILPSGADATVAISRYIAGSEDNFAVLMNQKAEELGLVNTHFTNSSGLYNENHYTTVRDLATIMACALDNPLCKTILSTTIYTPSAKVESTDGNLYSLWHGKLKGNEPTGVTVIAAKTGYETLAGNCMVSYAISADLKSEYILVTANGKSLESSTTERPSTLGSYQPIYDLKYLYSKYAK